MSTRDERFGSPTPTHTGDLPDAATPYTPSGPTARASAASTRPTIEEPTDRFGTEPAAIERPEDRRDRVRWGPIWAGAAIVMTVFIVLLLLFFALGWLDLGLNGGDGAGVSARIVTGVLALIAFFVGGLTAGSSTMWRRADDGLLHGVLVWALSVLGILALALVSGSALLGPLASFASQAPDAAPAAQNVDVDRVQALNIARDTAGWTALGLGAAAAAAAIGGVTGSKIWPGRKNTGATERHTTAA